MKPVLIIKTGSTVQGVAANRGDFEDWIIEDMQLKDVQFQVVSVFKGEPLPGANSVCAAIVTGSAAMVTDCEPWSESTAKYLAELVSYKIPVLGICYGHQLLAHALGGVVDYHPKGREIGTVKIRITDAGLNDSLMSGLTSLFAAHVSHSQTVITLPEGAVILAENDFEPHQAVCFSENAWGVQFHPEFDEEIIEGYISTRRQALTKEGFDPDRLLADVCEAKCARELLETFGQLLIGHIV